MKTKFFRLMAADSGANGGGGGVDRGDAHIPTDDDLDDDLATGTGKDAGKGADTGADAGADAGKGADAGADAGKGADAGADAGKEGDAKGDKGTKGMPFSRHKEILQKERDRAATAEAELAKLRQGNNVDVVNEEITAAEAQIAALDEEHAKLVTDGEHQKAAAKMSEIRKLERAVSDKRVALSSAAAESRAVERVRYETTVDRLEAAYPVLNEDHEDYDADRAQDVLDLAATYRARGQTPAAAIQKAAKRLLGAETRKQENATEVTARVDADDVAAALAKERREAAVAKNVDAAGKQPASTKKVGADSDKAGGSINAKDVLKMSQDDFKKLDEETLSRMRGDVIA